MGSAMGGTSGSEVTLPPVELFNEKNKPNQLGITKNENDDITKIEVVEEQMPNIISVKYICFVFAFVKTHSFIYLDQSQFQILNVDL